MAIIGRPRSVIPACDVMSIKALGDLVNFTCDVEGIEAYKVDGVGSCELRAGLEAAVAAVRDWTDLPIIFDFQKAGNDIPKMGSNFAEALEGLVQAAILFPFAGPETAEAWIKALQDKGLVPIVGGEMTHPKFLASDGGYIADDAPARIYELAASLGVRDFVVPGNKPEKVEKYRKLLTELCGDGLFVLYAPGFIGQGGVISETGRVAGELFHAIVGSGIYEATDIRAAAEEYCKEIVAA